MRAFTYSTRLSMPNPAHRDIGQRIDVDSNPGRRELADYLAVGEHLGLRPDETAACAHHGCLRPQTLDLARVYRTYEARKDVDRGDRLALNLLVAQDRGSRGCHGCIGKSCGHTALDHPEGVSQVRPGRHLVNGFASSELHKVHVQRL